MYYVLVYGTLMKGNYNERLLKDAEFIGEAQTTRDDFIMVNMDLGSRESHEFPAAVPGQGYHKFAGPVKGELYKVSARKLEALDAHEGCSKFDPRQPRLYGYYRIRVDVKLLDDKKRGDVWMRDVELYVVSRERAMDGLRRGGHYVQGGKWREPERNRAMREAREGYGPLPFYRNIQPRRSSLMDQPSPLALMRARKRFQGAL